MARSYRVLFVCTGNTCRSPMAEQMLRRELAQAGLAAEVASAGLRVTAVGQAADLRAQDVLRAHGYECEHQTRPFDSSMFASCDLVIGLDSMHCWVLGHLAPDREAVARIRLLGSFDPAAGAGWDVPDPVTGDRDDFERVLGMLRDAVPGVVAAVRAGLAAG